MQDFSSVLHAIAGYAKSSPDQPAIIEGETDRICTYGELWSYIKAFSTVLGDLGGSQGDRYGSRVVIRCMQTIDYNVAYFAILLAKGVVVPVERNTGSTRIAEIIQETDSRLFISDNPLDDYDGKYINLLYATAEHEDIADEKIVFPDPDDLATIIYTTGTTGRSKGVMHTFRSIKAKALNVSALMPNEDKDVYSIPLPLSHAFGLNRMYYALYTGRTMMLLNGFMEPKLFFSTIKKYKITVLSLISSMTGYLLKRCRDDLIEIRDQIKSVTIGGALTAGQISDLRSLFPNSRIIQTYCATEVQGCYIDHSVKEYASSCLGVPFEGSDLVFFDEQKQHIIDAVRDAPGLIALNGETKMLGYWKNPELTGSITREGYLVLSDLGYKGDDGLIYYLARADDVIISGGYKIAPSEIEDIANSMEGVSESVCVPADDLIMGQIPELYVVMESGYSFNAAEILRFLQSKLEKTKLPRRIHEIGEIPRIGGKINRKKLRKS